MDMSLLQTKMKPATPLPELQTVEDIYRWIGENIAYGWQDKDGGTHTSEMKDFRRLYRTNVCDGNPAAEDRNLH